MIRTRRHKRRSIWGVADVWNDNGDNARSVIKEPGMIFCLVKNISIGGLGMFSVTSIDVGTPVTIKRLKLFESQVDNSIQATIAWVNSRGNSFDIGVSFNEELDQDRYPEIFLALSQHRYNKISFGGIQVR